MLYFVSDSHFGHFNVIRYSSRPYDTVEEMDSALINNWNRIVKPEDTVWHLGDVAFYKDFYQLTELFASLNGNINIVLGNHDRLIENNREDLLSSGLIKSIQPYAEVKTNKQLIVLFHYGCRVWRNSHHSSILLYGHSHGSLPPWGKSVDVGVDSKEITQDYRPVSLDEVLTYMEKRSVAKADHHGGSGR